ncbi:MAG: hypothetical protein LBL87_04205 [Ruminococcus sp.]|nr:hypothetical protein [Ruminococcus sp.]
MIKKLVSLLLIFTLLPAYTPASTPVYYPYGDEKGTGSPRPETYTATPQYSVFGYLPTDCYGTKQLTVGVTDDEPAVYVYYENFSENTKYDINKSLLDGVLSDSKTEEKINNWVLAQYKRTGKHGVYYEAVNGYMSVVFGIFYDKKSDEKREAITSCWNLKTGEQLENFSDLFYEDSDFLPAVNAKFAGHTTFNSEDYLITADTKNFTFLRLTDSYFDGKYFEIQDRVSDEMNWWEAYKLMPAWEYFDMSPLFTKFYSGQVQYKTADLYTEWYSVYGKKSPLLKETNILRSRFLSDEEIARRNKELEALFDVIEQSDEYKNYKTEDSFIETSFDFSEDGKTAIVYTPFGEFTKKGDTVKTPSTDPIMQIDIGFLGYVDYDMNGTAEIITASDVVEIRNEKGDLVRFGAHDSGYKRGGVYALLWSVVKNSDGKITGSVSRGGAQYYYIEPEKPVDYLLKEGGVLPYSADTGETVSVNFDTDCESVVYSLGALDYGELEYASGKAKSDFDKLQKQIAALKKNSPDSYFAALNIEHGKTYILGTSNAEESFFINGNAVSKERLPEKTIRLFINGAFDSDPLRHENTQIIIFDDIKSNINCVPAFITGDDSLVFPFTRNGIGNHISGNDYDTYKIIAGAKTPNPYTDGTDNEIPGYRFTYIDYYFYRSGDKLIEYGAVPLSLERFKTIDGSDKTLEKIKEEGAVIDEILYRGEGLIHFNCRKKNEDGKEIFINYTARVSTYSTYDYETLETKKHFRMYGNFDTQWGVYLPSVFETIGFDTVVYPDDLPGTAGTK